MSIERKCGCGGEVLEGHWRCKRCHAAYMREWRKSHPDTRDGALARAQAQLAIVRARVEALKAEEQGVSMRQAARRIARKTFAVRNAARVRARQSRMRGTLVRQPCLICGAGSAQMHHVDYDRPLDVTWLCDTHHKGWHRFWRALVLEQFKLWVAELKQRASQRAA